MAHTKFGQRSLTVSRVEPYIHKHTHTYIQMDGYNAFNVRTTRVWKTVGIIRLQCVLIKIGVTHLSGWQTARSSIASNLLQHRMNVLNETRLLKQDCEEFWALCSHIKNFLKRCFCTLDLTKYNSGLHRLQQLCRPNSERTVLTSHSVSRKLRRRKIVNKKIFLLERTQWNYRLSSVLKIMHRDVKETYTTEWFSNKTSRK